MRPWLVGPPIVALVTVVLFASVASAVVKRIALTSPVTAGENATLTVNVTPPTECSARVASKPRAHALPRRVGGRITWRWKVPASTQAGRWPIVVTCGKSGLLRTGLAVRAAGPELPLLDAAKIICNRSPNRVLKKFPRLIAAHLHLVPNGLPLAVGTSNAGLSYQCGFFLEAASGHRPAAYSVTTTHTARCTYTARAGVDNSDYSALVETYAETCASLS